MLLDPADPAQEGQLHQGHIEKDGQLQGQALLLPVLGAEADARVDGRGRIAALEPLAVQGHGAGLVLVHAEDRSHDLAAARAHQSEEAQDLAGMDLEGHVPELLARQVLHVQDHVALAPAGLFGILLVQRPADHVGDQLLLGDVVLVPGDDVLAVPDDRDPVGEVHDLVEMVGDVHHGDVLLRELVDHPEQGVRLRLGEGRGGLVHDDEPGIPGQGPSDLQHLLLAHGQVAGNGLGGDVHAELLQDLRRAPVQLLVVHQAALHGQIADEQVFGHIKLGRDGQLLIDAGDAQLDGLLGILDMDLLPVDVVFPFRSLMGAGHNLDQGGFTRPVFAAEGVDLSLPYVKGYAVQGSDAGENLDDIPQLHENLFVLQNSSSFRPASGQRRPATQNGEGVFVQPQIYHSFVRFAIGIFPVLREICVYYEPVNPFYY